MTEGGAYKRHLNTRLELRDYPAAYTGLDRCLGWKTRPCLLPRIWYFTHQFPTEPLKVCCNACILELSYLVKMKKLMQYRQKRIWVESIRIIRISSKYLVTMTRLITNWIAWVLLCMNDEEIRSWLCAWSISKFIYYQRTCCKNNM